MKAIKSQDFKDKDLENFAGGSVSKIIFQDGGVEYRANSNEDFHFHGKPTG